MFQSKKQKPFRTNHGFLGGIHEREIDRAEAGRTAIRILQNDDSTKTAELYALGGWRELTRAEFEANCSAYHHRLREIYERHFPQPSA